MGIAVVPALPGSAAGRLRAACRWGAALAAAAGLLGCAAPHAVPRTPEQSAADARLSARVLDALQASPSIYARHVDVDTVAGVVRLSGFVYTVQELHAATLVATAVSGVQGVSNEIEIKSPFLGSRR